MFRDQSWNLEKGLMFRWKKPVVCLFCLFFLIKEELWGFLLTGVRLFQQRETEGESHAISARAGKPALTSSMLPNWLFVFNELTYCYSTCRLESIKTLMYFVKLALHVSPVFPVTSCEVSLVLVFVYLSVFVSCLSFSFRVPFLPVSFWWFVVYSVLFACHL